MPRKSTNLQQTHQLDNGLRLLLHPVADSPSATVVVMTGVGSRYEEAKYSGIAHFLEHMAFKGTTKRPSALDIASTVDNIGGETNAFTSKEYTGFYVRVAADDMPVAIDLLADMLFHSTFDQAQADRERNVILEEINMYNDSPREQVAEMFEKLLYPDQPLGREVTGTPDSLQAIGHSQLHQFNQQWYIPNNMVVAVTGNFNPNQVIELVSAAFNQPKASLPDSFQPAQYTQDQPQLIVRQKDTDQTQLVLGWRSYPSVSPHRYAVALLNVMLGGNMSSRLFTEVREKRGLAYSVHTSVDDYQDAGSLNCQVGLNHQSLDQAIPVILQQFDDLRQNGPADNELARAKSNLRGRLALSLEDNLGQTIFYARQWLLEGEIRPLPQILQGIDQVDQAHLTQVAQDLFVAGNLNAAVIGPKLQHQAILPLLKI